METKKYPFDRIATPINRFLSHGKSGGIVLTISTILAVLIANSPWSEHYFAFLHNKFGFTFNGTSFFNFSIEHWINDGLMSVFFFVVGLELKRELMAGELAQVRKAMLPIAAAIGGMVIPAFIYIYLNPTGEAHGGWGIPMATDIAFSLGVIHVLGKRIPTALKVFLTALAIVDDLGAVLVIAFFYTSDISMVHLLAGCVFAILMFISNRVGIRSIIWFAILGIGGVWTSFLLSGVHATIASVIAAFTIPMDMKISEDFLIRKLNKHIHNLKALDPTNKNEILSEDQLEIIGRIKHNANKSTPLLQKLEHAMAPYVTFLILPIFALANAGVQLDINLDSLTSTNVALGVSLGLLIGKVVGVVGGTLLAHWLKIGTMPSQMNILNLTGLGFLAAIGFTMSLFITTLAFKNPELINQAKIGIFVASILGGVIGYTILSLPAKKTT